MKLRWLNNTDLLIVWLCLLLRLPNEYKPILYVWLYMHDASLHTISMNMLREITDTIAASHNEIKLFSIIFQQKIKLGKKHYQNRDNYADNLPKSLMLSHSSFNHNINARLGLTRIGINPQMPR